MTKKRIKCTLSRSSIENAIKELQRVKTSLDKAGDEICSEIADECREGFRDRYSVLDFEDEPYGTSHYFETGIRQFSNKYEIFVNGPQVLFDEYGTGDVGAKKPHPTHDRDGMDGYSTWPYVRNHIDEKGHYWRFYAYFGHKYQMTPKLRGDKPGRFVYDTVQEIKDNQGKRIAKAHIKKILDDK